MIRMFAGLALVIFAGALISCSNPCAQAFERYQTCRAELCVEGGEENFPSAALYQLHCDREYGAIEQCSAAAKGASERLLEANDCVGVLNLYSTAHSMQGE